MKLQEAILQQNRLNSIMPMPSSQALLQQIITQSGLQDEFQQSFLKKRFDKKYSNHVNLIQYHKLRQDKFIQSQKKVIQKQHHSIEQARQYIENKHLRALQNKNKSLTQRNKKIQINLQRWQNKLQANKLNAQQKIQFSQELIHGWNQKLSESSSRKSVRLISVSQHLKDKMEWKAKKVQQFRRNLMEKRLKNPQNNSQQGNRYESISKVSKKSIRVSTQNLFDKKKRYQEVELEKSLIKIISKEERINEARYLKQFLLKKRKSQHQQKQEMIKRLRINHLQALRNNEQQKLKELDYKFHNNLVRMKSKSSLPTIQIKNNKMTILNGPGQEWRRNQSHRKHLTGGEIAQTERKVNRNYDKMIVEKLRDISLLMRKKKHQ